MRELFRCMKAELIKMRHTFLYPLHIAVPVLGSVLFLLYYCISGWNEITQISGYAEVIGIALPFVVSIVCTGSVELEEQNHFQNFLGSTVCRRSVFGGKYLVLLGLGMLAVFAAVFLFAAGYRGLLGKEGLSMEMYGLLATALCLGSVPMYLEHLLLNLFFSKIVSLGIGVAQFLLSALFLTGLGNGRWMFFPCTWSARGVALVLTDAVTGHAYGNDSVAFAACLLPLIFICTIIGVGFHFYEGRQCND